MKVMSWLVALASLTAVTAFGREVKCFGKAVPSNYGVVGYVRASECIIGFHDTGKNANEIEKAVAYEMIVCNGSKIPDGYHFVKFDSSIYCTLGFMDSIIDNAKLIRRN